VIAIYLREHGPDVANPSFLAHTAAPVVQWWTGRTLADIRGQPCRDYVRWRIAKGVCIETARHDLSTLRAAIRWYHAEHGPLDTVPIVTLPERGFPKERWLTRSDAAKFLRAARRSKTGRHVIRFFLIGIYTGTRPGAILALRWLPSIDGGWFDLEQCLLYRRGKGARETKKRQPPVRIHSRLLPHLRRWKRIDEQWGETAVCHYQGGTVQKLRNSWNTIRIAAGLGPEVTPHIVRHTAATWLLQNGVDMFEAAGYLGMSLEMLDRVYGHHHADFMNAAARSMPRKRENKGKT